MKTLGLALIGTGYMGKAHALAYRAARAVFGDLPEVRLAWLCDQTDDLARKMADQFGFQNATTDWRAMVCAPDVDIVSITSPNAFHYDMALAAIEAGDAITAISICGMGGERIRDILDSGKARLTGQERLILQPNGGEQPLRQWLMDNGYRILSEEVLRENRFAYEIIVAERSGPVTYSAEELYFGPLQMQARSPAFLAKWQRLLRLKQQTLVDFAQARQTVPEAKVQQLTQQTQWIMALLA